jgi:hypothetical protein
MPRVKVISLLLAVGLFAQVALLSSTGRAQKNTYAETRQLLLKVERESDNKPLKKLFKEADARMSHLIDALNDPDKAVNLNSQIVLTYLAAPEGLAAMESWYRWQRKQGKGYHMAAIKLLSEVRYLQGEGTNFGKLALKNAPHLEAGKSGGENLSARLIAHNKKYDTALIEIMAGEIFTTGWHIVIRREAGKWRLVSDSLVWES